VLGFHNPDNMIQSTYYRFQMERQNMPITDPIYTFTAPVFVKALGGLRHVLEKAKAHCTKAGIEESDLLESRLAPDMFPLVKQVQVATDNTKGAVARLSGGEAPKFEDTETTIEELLARIDKTIEYVRSVPESNYAGAADRQVVLPYFNGKYMTGFDYAREYAIPNVFFHISIAYALVRQAGADIGKADYINGVPLRSQ
jgi:uncharacterized protein